MNAFEILKQIKFWGISLTNVIIVLAIIVFIAMIIAILETQVFHRPWPEW